MMGEPSENRCNCPASSHTPETPASPGSDYTVATPDWPPTIEEHGHRYITSSISLNPTISSASSEHIPQSMDSAEIEQEGGGSQIEVDDDLLPPPWLPVDASEERRLGCQHELYKLILNGSLTASILPAPSNSTMQGRASSPGSRRRASFPKSDRPMMSTDDDPPEAHAGPSTCKPSSPLRVLDLGTGTGQWCVDLALRRPDAQITGIDINPMFLPSRVPSNVSFEIDDIRKPWARKPDSVDLCHFRNLMGSIRDQDEWKSVLSEVKRCLKPGGCVEVSEIRARWWDWGRVWGDLDDDEGDDGVEVEKGKELEIGKGPVVRRFERLFHRVAKQQGVDLDPAPKLADILTKLGFTKVVERTEIVPYGTWPKDEKLRRKGELYLGMMKEGTLENYSMKLFTSAGWTEGEVKAILEKVEKDLVKPELRGYSTAVFVMAKKPLTAGSTGRAGKLASWRDTD